MAKKKYYMVVDTETATLPFANDICSNAKEKQTIAIAKPLVYDIGWVIMDRQGNIVTERNFLVQETFFVPNVFNTAYYKDKRPIYMKLYEEGKILAGNWNEIMLQFMADCQKVDILAAYNATFDFKKAIPFTEKYIQRLYSSDYNEWEEKQKKRCKEMVKAGKAKGNNPDFLEPWLDLRGVRYPIVDLWGVACNRLINIDKYRNFCLDNDLVTASVQYFKTSAETSFQYLGKQHDFIEAHTALEDAKIEAAILAKALKKGKVEPYVEAFPFRNLGTTFNYAQEKKPKYKKQLRQLLNEYIEENNGFELAENGNRYWKRMIKTLENL